MLTVKRLVEHPIVSPALFSGPGGDNINGPSLISVPAWLPHPLGRFYLYFSHHRGDSIRLAYADQLSGPWTLHEGGSLKLHEAIGCHDHIASPDVHVDHGNKTIRMYFHGVVKGRPQQATFFAESRDGIIFVAQGNPIADFYLRAVPWRDGWFAMSKGGVIYVADGSGEKFIRLRKPAFTMRHPEGNAPGDVRHVALSREQDIVTVYYTQIGTAPEHICRARVDLSGPQEYWQARNAELVLKPELDWEGVRLPLTMSRAGAAQGPENALRDPAILNHAHKTYLLYTGAGESGIGIAEIIE